MSTQRKVPSFLSLIRDPTVPLNIPLESAIRCPGTEENILSLHVLVNVYQLGAIWKEEGYPGSCTQKEIKGG